MLRTSRGRVVAAAACYSEAGSEEDEPAFEGGDQAWAPALEPAACYAGLVMQQQQAQARQEQQHAFAPGGGCGGGSGAAGAADAQEQDWEEADLAAMSPASQKRERRRIANRDCARRIRQRQTELLAELSASVEGLQADNNRLLATLAEVTRCWRDTTLENCELRSQLALTGAGSSGGVSRRTSGSGGSEGSPPCGGDGGGGGSGSEPSPMMGLGPSPGADLWPSSPMLL